MWKMAVRIVSAPLAAVLLTAGCASSTHGGLNSRFIVPAGKGRPAAAPYDTGAPADSLEIAIGRIREVSARAHPSAKRIVGPTIESMDGQLAAALLALDVFPSAETHRRVAREYARLGIFDASYGHYQAVTRINPRDADAYDALARLWRDAGLAALALGDARRAVYFAPNSPEALNTLGTVLQALGNNREARNAYE